MARSIKLFAQIAQKNTPLQMYRQFRVQYAERRADSYAVVYAVPRAVVRAEICADARAVIRADRFAEKRAVMCADNICRHNFADAENCAVLRAENSDIDDGASRFSTSIIQFRYLYSNKAENYSTKIKIAR